MKFSTLKLVFFLHKTGQILSHQKTTSNTMVKNRDKLIKTTMPDSRS